MESFGKRLKSAPMDEASLEKVSISLRAKKGTWHEARLIIIIFGAHACCLGCPMLDVLGHDHEPLGPNVCALAQVLLFFCSGSA
jgi:hypothetical protein